MVHVRQGLIDVLRSDDRLDVAVSEDGRWSHGRVGALAGGGVVVLDEAAERLEAEVLRAAQPELGIVVQAHEPTYVYGLLLLAAGMTCLPQDASAAAVLRAVHLTAQKGCAFVWEGHLIERRDRRNERVLTKREIDVLERMSTGMSPTAIAEELAISIATVRHYTTSLRRKLRISSLRELAGLYIPSMLRHS